MSISTVSSRWPAGGRAAVAAFVWSLTAVAVGLWQLADPEGGPFADPVSRPVFGVPAALPDGSGAVALAAAGLAGLVLAGWGRRLWPVAAALAVVFGLGVPGTSVMPLVGYSCALLMPVALVAAPVLIARGRLGRTLAAAGVVAVVSGLVVAGPLAPSVVAGLGRELWSGLLAIGWYPLAELWSAVGGACWAVLAVRRYRARGAAAPAWAAPERAARWGRVAACAAFACALPYGLTRLTWLTPWPFLMSAEALEAEPGLRLWGLLLGAACLAGGVLCLGLARRWGERWPYWVPVLRGRPVPPPVAIVPASVVAYLFTVAAVPFVVSAFRSGRPELVWMFPFFVWGPALGAATVAYAVRRRAGASAGRADSLDGEAVRF
ncbi:hypothetical protein [Glycomyces xiaoerkulensis]|uniref:hypothetical protein n=1 Tax=Glycomyces xiaoerkulensis TaxID=2038139 RepID=UPI000C268308|nr:hypothetical protein [Glycomyces xiaoerkulensis]